MSNILFTGKVYYRFDELPSTNDLASEFIAKSKPAEGTVIRADTQTAGRGQFGSRWLSTPGQNLLLSVIYYPQWLAARDQFYLGMAVALGLKNAVDQAIAASGVNPPPSLEIKWPNDLYVNGKKAAGILIQNSLSGMQIESSVIGIGLNVNQLEFDPALPNPTSLALECGESLDLEKTMHLLFEHLEHQYLKLKNREFSQIKSAYENALFRRGLASDFIQNNTKNSFTGVITGVTESGRLRVYSDGTETTFDLKEIFLKPD